MSRNTLFVVLAGANLLLLSGLILLAYSPPAAMAQVEGGGSGFAVVSAQAELRNDAVYVLDGANHLLHAWRVMPYPRTVEDPIGLIYMDSRDLARDFRERDRDREKAR
ncbi:MAG: hypothetical protein KA354_07475 [Phycisphaerae bacterium]|nr:hypothetical protein [Phycisphaerae bacterium]